MADIRPGIGVITQLGVETTPGGAAAVNRFLRSLNINVTSEFGVERFTPQGFRANTTTVKQKKMAKGGFEGPLCYNAVSYVFDGLFNAAVPETIELGDVDAYTRLWTAGMKTSDNGRKTYTVERGDETAVDLYKHVQFQSFNLEADQDNFKISGNLLARKPIRNQVQTANATEVAESPVERDDIQIYLDDTAANIGTTPLANTVKESIQMNDKFVEAFFHNRAIESFTGTVESKSEPTGSFTKEADAQARSLAAAIENTSGRFRKYLRWEAVGGLLGNDGTADIYELLQIDIPIEFGAPKDIGIDAAEPYAYEFPFFVMSDSDLGTYMRIKSVSRLAAV